MNRVTKLSALALAPLASAQQSGAAQPGNLSARTSQRRPSGKMPIAFILARKVDSLNVIVKDPKTAFTRAQAAQLLALLEPLRTAKTLTGAQATRVSASIDQILTPAQRPSAQRPTLRVAESQRDGRPQGDQLQNGQVRGSRMQGTQMRNGQMKGTHTELS